MRIEDRRARAGVTLGEKLRGKELATYVVASATDGYQVVFSLAELDPAFIANDVIVADTVDGQPIPRDPGPLRLVVPKESRAARSVRMLERLAVVRLRK
jgi:DMSO/TMAO reductase YedYZ molybdopterin-dependent catalytic subunit